MTLPTRVPFLDLRATNEPHADAISQAMAEVLRSGRYLFGDQLFRFESAYADYCGVRHCIGVANGLDALRLTLQAWMTLGRLQPDDEVIVPANSFIASALAVEQAGLRVRFADVDETT